MMYVCVCACVSLCVCMLTQVSDFSLRGQGLLVVELVLNIQTIRADLIDMI